MTTALLVHGMWNGAWAWDAVRAAASLPTRAVDLEMRSLADDADVVRAAIDGIAELDDDVVLVGHSYGGAVITAVGPHPAVRRLVYLAAFLLDEGESVSRVAPGSPVPPTALGDALRFSDDRSEVTVDPALAPELLYGQTPDDVVRDALPRFRPVARSVFGERPAQLSWRTIPSTYVVCARDRTVAPELQRLMAARATESREWDSDHSPIASHPSDVAALLDSFA